MWVILTTFTILQVAETNNDVQLQEFVEGEFLNEQVKFIFPNQYFEKKTLRCYQFCCLIDCLPILNVIYWYMQVEAIKKISEYVAQLRRVGKGHGKLYSPS